MGLRSMLVAVGLGTLWGGCKTGGLGKLPDSANATAAFSPDGREIYVLQPHRMYVWDLAGKRIAQDRKVQQDEAGIAFSPAGAYVALAAQNKDDRKALVSLIRARDGQTVLTRELLDAEASSDRWYPRRTQAILAATDDGRWLAAFRLDSREVEIASVPDGRPALRTVVEGYFRSLAFNAAGDHLFVSSEAGPKKQTVMVLASSGGKWASVATLDGAFHPAWTAQGLAYASDRGIEMWSPTHARILIPKDPQIDLRPDANEAWFRVSPDGTHCILWDVAGFSVRETGSGKTVVAQEVDANRTPAVWAVAFLPGKIRALLATGDLVDVDLSARSVSRRASFGRPGQYSRNWLQDGASWDPSYSALLSPDGRYVALYRKDSGYELFATE
ncbi:MAG TPA: hypothetical protein VEP66_05575 [Myxococcales bacterium]|nr:hypothetical protein [Myxococcales bacterium]